MKSKLALGVILVLIALGIGLTIGLNWYPIMNAFEMPYNKVVDSGIYNLQVPDAWGIEQQLQIGGTMWDTDLGNGIEIVTLPDKVFIGPEGNGVFDPILFIDLNWNAKTMDYLYFDNTTGTFNTASRHVFKVERDGHTGYLWYVPTFRQDQPRLYWEWKN